MEKFFSAIGRFISKHLSGGVVWIYVITGATILMMYGYINYLEARLYKVAGERDAAISQSLGNASVGNSLGRQVKKQQQNQKEQANANNEIDLSPNPLGYAFELVCDKRKRASGNSDKSTVCTSDKTESAEP